MPVISVCRGALMQAGIPGSSGFLDGPAATSARLGGCTGITADGLIGFHISNRYMDLAPVVAGLARPLRAAGTKAHA